MDLARFHKKLGVCGVSVLVAFLGRSAQAADYYVAAQGSAVWASDSTWDVIDTDSIARLLAIPTVIDTDIKTDLNPGFGASAAFGARFNDRLRVEGELRYVRNTIDGGRVLQVPLDYVGGAAGDVALAFAMGNVYLDIPLRDWSLKPYVGAGLGWSQVDAELAIGGFSAVDASDGVFAYQLMVGAAYPVSIQAEIFAGYRFSGIRDATFEWALPTEVEFDWRAHQLDLGVRWYF
ncbi:MAG: outer membrane beta-barrel protein [Pseudomonadota bacterium]|nr:outer membrane beta-barrel protein [Pseudomonadota bacterium]